MATESVNTGAGKGDKPRNCFSSDYKSNYDEINWGKKSKKEKRILEDQNEGVNDENRDN